VQGRAGALLPCLDWLALARLLKGAAACHRPWAHSASFWPRLFADEPGEVAADDGPGDYSDLPAPLAAAHAAAEAADEARRVAEAAQRARRERLQGQLERRQQRRAERLRELRAQAWARAAA
jgi:hypothetical protein